MAIYIGLGANQTSNYNGHVLEPIKTFIAALEYLKSEGVKNVSKYSLWKSPAWPDPAAQPSYRNTVVEVETELEPLGLLKLLKTTEVAFGRTEGVRNAPRPLDLDILDYNEKVFESETLSLPHPRMCARAFVLFPLQDSAPSWRDPIKNRTIQDWIARLPLEDVEPLERL